MAQRIHFKNDPRNLNMKHYGGISLNMRQMIRRFTQNITQEIHSKYGAAV
jgi:hypothetical protein